MRITGFATQEPVPPTPSDGLSGFDAARAPPVVDDARELDGFTALDCREPTERHREERARQGRPEPEPKYGWQ
jgi:hypothetical protein